MPGGTTTVSGLPGTAALPLVGAGGDRAHVSAIAGQVVMAERKTARAQRSMLILTHAILRPVHLLSLRKKVPIQWLKLWVQWLFPQSLARLGQPSLGSHSGILGDGKMSPKIKSCCIFMIVFVFSFQFLRICKNSLLRHHLGGTV